MKDSGKKSTAAPRKAGGKRRAVARPGTLAALAASPRLSALVVFVVAFLAYANTLGHGFVWDDRDLIVENPAVRTLDAATVRNVLFTNFWKGAQNGGYYRPLVTLTYHVQWKVFHGNPHGFHFANVTWNAMACVLAFMLLYLLFRRTLLALAAALLFALHPLHTESVAWISGRTDVLAMLWGLASLTLYVAGRQRRRGWLVALALFAGFVALLGKESAVFVPVAVVVMELWPALRARVTAGRARGGPAWAVMVGYVAVVGLYLALRAHAIGTSVSSYTPYAHGVLRWVGLPLAIVAGSMLKLVAPFRLNAEWDVPVPQSLADPWVIGGFLVLVVLAAVLWRFRRRGEVVLGMTFLAGGLAPVLNIIPLGEVSAERFLYVPSLGFVLLLAAIAAPAFAARLPGSEPALPRRTAATVALVFIAVAVAWGVRTVTRNPVWHDEQTLFTTTEAADPGSARAHLNVGNVARRQGRLDDAIAAYKRALAVKPDYPDALSNLAGIYVQQGHFDQALPLAKRAIEAAPDNVTLRANLGSLYFQTGHDDEAAAELERVLQTDDANASAHFTLGMVRVRQRRLDDARRQFERVAGLGGRYTIALYYLAEIANSGGNTAAARDYARRFLQVHPQKDRYRQRAEQIAGGG